MPRPTSSAAEVARVPSSAKAPRLGLVDLLDVRSSRSPPQPPDAEQIDEADPETIVDPVLAPASGPRSMADLHGLHAATVALDQGGQEAVHVIEAWEGQIGLARDQFQPATRVRDSVLQNRLPQGVGETRRESLGPSVPAPASDSGDHLQIRRSLRRVASIQECGNVRGIVLSIAVQRGHPVRARGLEAGVERGALAAALAVPQDPQELVARKRLRKHLQGVVRATVVDDDEFVLDPRIQGALDLVDQGRKAGSFVVSGDDDTQVHDS